MKPPLPTDEEARLRALRRYEILDTPTEQEYDDLTLLAAQICDAPIAAITMIDENRQWHKSKIGIALDEAPRDISFCAHAIVSSAHQPFIVKDASKDERFTDNPFVTDNPNVRFYAGVPLVTPDNFAIGSICVIDREPRELTEQQLVALQALARQVALRLELRRTSALLRAANEDLRNLSLTDELTGLYNRRGFLLHAEQQLKLFQSRRTDRGLWLMMADMDGLKQINDTFGHEEGSFAIAKAGEILKKTFRDADVIARLGGDEFVVLIINALDEVEGKTIERLENYLAEYNKGGEKPYAISISYGLVSIVFGGTASIDDTMKRADETMYEHKRRRRQLDSRKARS